MSRRSAPEVIRVPKPRVREAFDWDDPAVYRWAIRWERDTSRSAAWLQMAGEALALAMAPGAAMLLLLWLVKQVWAAGSFWVAAVLGVLALGDYLGALLVLLRGRATTAWRAKARNRPVLASMALACLAWAIAVPGSPIGASFAGGQPDIPAGQWALYFWEHARATLLLDLPRLLGGRLTSISPVTPVAVAAALGFRILFGLGVVEMAVAGWRRLGPRTQFHATVRGAWAWSEPTSALEGELRREGRLVEPEDRPEPVRAIEFVHKLHHLAR